MAIGGGCLPVNDGDDGGDETCGAGCGGYVGCYSPWEILGVPLCFLVGYHLCRRGG